MNTKYINPFTDFGFKKLFGEEASKSLLIDFLNSLLPDNDKILKLSFKNQEQLGRHKDDRKAVYDIYCENEKGEKFIVELQKTNQDFFKDRTIYYSTFPIQNQAIKGPWNYKLKSVYCIGILDFTFKDYEIDENQNQVVHTIKLKNQNGKVFYDKLTYIYLEMPNFTKTESELSTRLDKWLYFINNLEDIHSVPEIFNDVIFKKAFKKVELAKLVGPEFDSYQASLKVFRDNYATYDYAMNIAPARTLARLTAELTAKTMIEGTNKGKEIGEKIGKEIGEKIGKKKGEKIGKSNEKIETIRNGKKIGLDTPTLIKLTGLSKKEIDAIN